MAEQAHLRAREVWTLEVFPDGHNHVQDLLKGVRTAMVMYPPRP